MADAPSNKNDPSADWPEEVKQAYEHLKIPSLYDAVIANEKLSLEIRRQDRELKTIAQGIQQLSMQMGELLTFVEEEDDEDTFIVETTEDGFNETHDHELTDLEMQLLKENQGILQQQSQAFLMDTHDDMRELWRMAKQVIQQVLVLMPKTEGVITYEPVWHTITEQMLQSLLESIENPRYQLLIRLEQMKIKLIEPQQGENINLSLHYIVDRIPGGKEGTVARVVRVGYIQNQEVLRQAEVTVYH